MSRQSEIDKLVGKIARMAEEHPMSEARLEHVTRKLVGSLIRLPSRLRRYDADIIEPALAAAAAKDAATSNLESQNNAQPD